MTKVYKHTITNIIIMTLYINKTYLCLHLSHELHLERVAKIGNQSIWGLGAH